MKENNKLQQRHDKIEKSKKSEVKLMKESVQKKVESKKKDYEKYMEEKKKSSEIRKKIMTTNKDKVVKEYDKPTREVQKNELDEKFKKKNLYNIKKESESINPTWVLIEKNTSVPELKTSTMRKLGILEFDVAKYWNTCLSNRMHIMNNMDIVTCLGKTEVIGNLRTDNLSDIISYLYEHQWKDTKVVEKGNGCSLCEFRYSCSPCVLTQKQELCSIT